MKTRLLTGFSLIVVLAISSLAGAALIYTPEAAGLQQSTLPDLLTETFDSAPAGPLGTYVSPIGTFSSGAAIVTPNAFGGGGQSQYISVGVQSGTFDYSLTFNGPQSYFGFYWGAGDPWNEIWFYDQGNEVGHFTVAMIGIGLGAEYYGNPTTLENTVEPYVYLNFFGTQGTTFDSVRFGNYTFDTGFEADNFSISAPEPMSMGLMGLGSLMVLRRRR